MRHIQKPRFYGHETGVRYRLDIQNDCEALNSLSVCFLLAKDTNMSFESLSFSMVSVPQQIVLHKEDIDQIKSLDNFLSQFVGDVKTWHLQMTRNNYTISFGSCCNNEIGCTYHHWCLIDVDSLIEELEEQVNRGVIVNVLL